MANEQEELMKRWIAADIERPRSIDLAIDLEGVGRRIPDGDRSNPGARALSDAPTQIEPSPRRGRGRPPGRLPAVDYSLARSLYDDGLPFVEIARRVKTTVQGLHAYGRRHWPPRPSAGRGQPPTPPISAPRLVALPGGSVSAAPSVETRPSSPEQILTRYIALFAEAVERGTLRHDTVADLDKAVRLLSHVRGEASTVTATHTTVTLEVMQQRHKALREYVREQVDDEVAGVLGMGEPIDADDDASEEPQRAP
jgi:hypothetical protein